MKSMNDATSESKPQALLDEFAEILGVGGGAKPRIDGEQCPWPLHGNPLAAILGMPLRGFWSWDP